MKNKRSNLRIELAIFLVVLSLIIFFVSFKVGYSREQDKLKFDKDIVYKGLTKEEINFFNNVLNQINPIYLTSQKKIIVAKNISDYCDSCSGSNYGHGTLIVLKYKEDEEYLKRIITHEFLHTYFIKNFGENGIEDPIHRIIYELSDKLVAFE